MSKIRMIAGVCGLMHRGSIVLPVTVEQGSDAAKQVVANFLQRPCRVQEEGRRQHCGLPLVGFALLGGSDKEPLQCTVNVIALGGWFRSQNLGRATGAEVQRYMDKLRALERK